MTRSIARINRKHGVGPVERTISPADLTIGRLVLGRDMTPRAVMKSVHRRIEQFHEHGYRPDFQPFELPLDPALAFTEDADAAPQEQDQASAYTAPEQAPSDPHAG